MTKHKLIKILKALRKDLENSAWKTGKQPGQDLYLQGRRDMLEFCLQMAQDLK